MKETELKKQDLRPKDGKDGIQGPQGEKGEKGDKGEQGIQGIQGEKGEKGDKGDRGEQGIQGEKGEQGIKGDKGENGKDGKDGKDGIDGKDGNIGLSAYDIAVKNGFEGTEPEWLKSLKGKRGPKGDQGEKGDNGFSITGIGIPRGSGGGGEWGSITGDINSQTDLIALFSAKQDIIATGTTSQYLRGDGSLATFPTNVSSFINDIGYITSASLAGYVPYTGATSNVNLGTFTLTTPQLIGGTGAASKLTYTATTSGSTTTTNVAHEWYLGNSGSTLALTMLQSGNMGLGTSYSQTVNGVDVSSHRQFKITGSGLTRLTVEGGSYGLLDFVATSSTANNRRFALYTNGGEFYLQGFNDAGTITKYFLKGDINGNLAIGNVNPAARLHIISTTEQLRVAYDTNNYYSTTVGSTGIVTFNAVGSGASFVFSDGISLPYVSKTANYTVTSSDYTIDCTANSFTVTLPTAVGRAGAIFNIKNTGTGTITIATTSSQTIDLQASGYWKLAQYDCITVQSNGTNWIII